MYLILSIVCFVNKLRVSPISFNSMIYQFWIFSFSLNCFFGTTTLFKWIFLFAVFISKRSNCIGMVDSCIGFKSIFSICCANWASLYGMKTFLSVSYSIFIPHGLFWGECTSGWKLYLFCFLALSTIMLFNDFVMIGHWVYKNERIFYHMGCHFSKVFLLSSCLS